MSLALLVATAWGGTLSGQVVDPDGVPVANASVYAYDQRMYYASDQADPDGRFALELPDNRYRVRVLPPSGVNFIEQFVPGAADYCDGDVWAVAGDIDVGTVVLGEGGLLAGRVTGFDGTPLDGASLTAEIIAPMATYEQHCGATTDPDRPATRLNMLSE